MYDNHTLGREHLGDLSPAEMHAYRRMGLGSSRRMGTGAAMASFSNNARRAIAGLVIILAIIAFVAYSESRDHSSSAVSDCVERQTQQQGFHGTPEEAYNLFAPLCV